MNGHNNGGLDAFDQFQYTYTYGDVYIPKIKMSEPLKNECLHFLDCINNQKQPLTSGIEGTKVVRILERAEESLHSDGEYVPLQEEEAYGIVGRPKWALVERARSIWKGLGFEKIF